MTSDTQTVFSNAYESNGGRAEVSVRLIDLMGSARPFSAREIDFEGSTLINLR